MRDRLLLTDYFGERANNGSVLLASDLFSQNRNCSLEESFLTDRGCCASLGSRWAFRLGPAYIFRMTGTNVNGLRRAIFGIGERQERATNLPQIWHDYVTIVSLDYWHKHKIWTTDNPPMTCMSRCWVWESGGLSTQLEAWSSGLTASLITY